MIVHSNDTRRLVNVSDEYTSTVYISNLWRGMFSFLLLSVNARNKDGASAIHFAAGDGSVPRMQLLCDAGQGAVLFLSYFLSLR